MELQDSQEPSYTTATQIVRMIRLLQQQPDHTMSIKDLAALLEVHERTVKRYIAAIGEAVQVEGPSGEAQPLIKRVRRGRSPFAVLARDNERVITDVEVAAKAFAANLFGVVDPEGFGVYADYASDELKRERPLAPVPFEEAFVYVPFGPRASETKGAVFNPLMRAVLNRLVVTIRYQKVGADEAKEYVAEPHCFLLYRDALYVHVFYEDEDGKKTPRTLMLDRILNVRVHQGQVFARQKSFRAKDFHEKTLGIWSNPRLKPEKVLIEFREEAAPLIAERRWPGNGQLTPAGEEKGAGVHLRMQVPITPELCAWIASYGKNARVLAPDTLQDAMRDYLGDALDYYI